MPSIAVASADEREPTAVERRSRFVAEAVLAHAEMLATGNGHDGAEVHDYLRRRLLSRHLARPAMKAWRN